MKKIRPLSLFRKHEVALTPTGLRTWILVMVIATWTCVSRSAQAGECWTVTRIAAVDAEGRVRSADGLDQVWRIRELSRSPVEIGNDLCPGDSLFFSRARIELQRTARVDGDDQTETALLHNDSARQATVTLDDSSLWQMAGLEAAYFKLYQALHFTYDSWLNGSNEGTELALLRRGAQVVAATLQGRVGVGTGPDRMSIEQGSHALFAEQGSDSEPHRTGLVARDRLASKAWLHGSPVWLVGALAGPVVMGSDPGVKLRAYTRLRTFRWLRIDAELASVLTTTRSTVYDADGDGVPSMAEGLTMWHIPLTLGVELGPAPISLNPQALVVIECEIRQGTQTDGSQSGCKVRPHPGGLIGLRGELMRRRHVGFLWSLRGGMLYDEGGRVDPYVDIALGMGGGL